MSFEVTPDQLSLDQLSPQLNFPQPYKGSNPQSQKYITDAVPPMVSSFLKRVTSDIRKATKNFYGGGGCFKNIFLRQDVRDIDVFFSDETSFEKAYQALLINDNYRFLYENRNAVCFENKRDNINIELIRRDYFDYKTLLTKFDFTIVKMVWLPLDNTLYYHHQFYEHLLMKKLAFDTSEPLSFVLGAYDRAFKYSRYGYHICPGSMLHLLNELRKSNETSNFLNNSYLGFD